MSSMEGVRRGREASDKAVSWPYVRGRDGVWHYSWGGVVPGARDCTLGDLYGYSPTEIDGRLVVNVPVTAWIDDHRLAWTAAYADPRENGPVIVVPLSAWKAHDQVVTMLAPELLATELLDTTAVARLYGVSPRVIANYLSRELLPGPVTHLGGSPVWPRPLIAHALEQRPGRGRRRRPRGPLPHR
jgi:hypothetical protein